jgi:hypothetical protein
LGLAIVVPLAEMKALPQILDKDSGQNPIAAKGESYEVKNHHVYCSISSGVGRRPFFGAGTSRWNRDR